MVAATDRPDLEPLTVEVEGSAGKGRGELHRAGPRRSVEVHVETEPVLGDLRRFP
jgi:hypothetical protein